MKLKSKIKRIFTTRNIENCKKDIPKVKYSDSSWISMGVTPDQERIENHLADLQINNKRILQVGTGNSSFAKKFSHNNLIDSITIMDEEIEFANSLKLPNYTIFKINKYADDIRKLPGKYDFIIDNNPSSFACCRLHFSKMMENYARLLNENGRILSDKKGMEYFEEYAFPVTVDQINAQFSFLRARALGSVVEISLK